MGRAKLAGAPAEGTRLRCLLTGAGKGEGKGAATAAPSPKQAARAAKQPRSGGSRAPNTKAKKAFGLVSAEAEEGAAHAASASAEASGLVSTEAAPAEAPAGTARVYPSGFALQCAACDNSFVRWSCGDVCDCGLMLCYGCADHCGCKEEEDKHRASKRRRCGTSPSTIGAALPYGFIRAVPYGFDERRGGPLLPAPRTPAEGTVDDEPTQEDLYCLLGLHEKQRIIPAPVLSADEANEICRQARERTR